MSKRPPPSRTKSSMKRSWPSSSGFLPSGSTRLPDAAPPAACSTPSRTARRKAKAIERAAERALREAETGLATIAARTARVTRSLETMGTAERHDGAKSGPQPEGSTGLAPGRRSADGAAEKQRGGGAVLAGRKALAGEKAIDSEEVRTGDEARTGEEVLAGEAAAGRMVHLAGLTVPASMLVRLSHRLAA